MKTVKIRKGCHWSGFPFKPHYNKRELEYKIQFDRSAIYDLGDNDQKDVNKLFGLSYGFHHDNSIRFGWRCRQNNIEILSYCYVEGNRLTPQLLAIISPGKQYTYKIKSELFCYSLSINGTESPEVTTNIYHAEQPKWGYHLYPYFGGNKTAPHKITIKFDKVK